MSGPFGPSPPSSPHPFGGSQMPGMPYGGPSAGGAGDGTQASPFGGPPTAAGTSATSLGAPFGTAPFGTAPFGSAPVPSGRQASATTSAPVQWLVAGAVLAAVALLAALLFGGTVTVAIAAWLVAGPAVIGLLALYTLRQTRALALPFATRPSSGLRFAYAGVVVLALCAVLVSAWRIAEWAGRL